MKDTIYMFVKLWAMLVATMLAVPLVILGYALKTVLRVFGIAVGVHISDRHDR